MMFGVSRLHRRMHNKMLVADNVAAVVGGRNLADEYFGAAPDVNFADLDLLIAGPVVQELSASFDEYWNSRWAVPVESISLVKVSSAEAERTGAQLTKRLEEHRKQNPAYFERAEQLSGGMTKLQPELPWVWATGHAVYDTPEKMGDTGALEAVNHIGPRLLQQLDPIQSELVMISAYFIPGNGGTEKLGALARRGVSVSVITNGLASTDVTAVFAAYAAYRERLLRDGVQLYEIRTDPGLKAKARERGLAFGSSAVSLHTKAIVFDGSKVFIGSMNLDPRSQRWNTEVGVLVDSREIAEQVLALARIAMEPENSYHVVLEPQDHGAARLNWIATENGREVRHMSEPAGSWRRFKATITDPLLPEELL